MIVGLKPYSTSRVTPTRIHQKNVRVLRTNYMHTHWRAKKYIVSEMKHGGEQEGRGKKKENRREREGQYPRLYQSFFLQLKLDANESQPWPSVLKC